MSDYCVVVADGARARLFSLEDAAIGDMGPNLVESSDLANPEAEAAGKEVWSDDKPGRNTGSGGSAHGYDDHRSHHHQEIENRFAKQIAGEINKMVSDNKVRNLVLAAEKKMLGHMRDALTLHASGIKVNEIAKDLTKMSTVELHQYLADHNALPQREIR